MSQKIIREVYEKAALKWNIKAVEGLMKGDELGSGTRGQWDERLEVMRCRLKELEEAEG